MSIPARIHPIQVMFHRPATWTLGTMTVPWIATAFRNRAASRQCGLGERLGRAVGSAARKSGGQLVASGRIPIQALAAAIEADEAMTKEGD